MLAKDLKQLCFASKTFKLCVARHASARWYMYSLVVNVYVVSSMHLKVFGLAYVKDQFFAMEVRWPVLEFTDP
jgi:hypothetical protein